MVLPLKLPLGTSEFRKLRQTDTYYADKTDLIRELIDLPQDALLLPRPRRFGKTTNLSMLRAFFGKHSEDLSGLFAGLAIWQAGPQYRAHFGRYPVISLSFKEVKAATWDECRSAIAIALSRGFAEHEELLSEAKLSAGERRLVQAIVDRQPLTSDTAAALLDLSAILHRHHGQPALILIDEYDTPISDHVTLHELHNSPDGIWSLMLHAGYLKYLKVRTDPAEARLYAELCIPNQEIRYVFVQSVLSWIASSEQGTQPLDELLAAMLKGDTEIFGSRLFDLALRVLSFQDTAGPETEKVYQAFALGLLVKLLPRYEVDSNRESGLGRYDVLALPKEAGQPGVVLEFKVADTPSAAAVRRALRETLTQIAHKGYGERLRQRGAAPILCYGVACHGKQVWVQRGGSSAIYGAPLRKPARTSRKATGPKRSSRPAAKTSH